MVVAAGDARFAPFEELRPEAFARGLAHKLMGQVTVALEALRRLRQILEREGFSIEHLFAEL